MSARRWTVDDLRGLNACAEQVALFAATFPDGATVADIPHALAVGLNVEWLVRQVVRPGVWRAYEEATAPLWRVYEEATAPLLVAALETVAEEVAE